MEIRVGSLLRAAAASLLALAASGCVIAPVMPPRGLIYTDQKAPLFSGGKPGSKVGKSSAHSILFLVGWGDGGLAKALENGGITEVRHTDYRVENYFLFYQKYTTIVHGE